MVSAGSRQRSLSASALGCAALGHFEDAEMVVVNRSLILFLGLAG